MLDLVRLREEHHKAVGAYTDFCEEDGKAWPCPTIRLLARLDAAEAALTLIVWCCGDAGPMDKQGHDEDCQCGKWQKEKGDTWTPN